MARDVRPLGLVQLFFIQQFVGVPQGFSLPLQSLILSYFLSCASATGGFTGVDHDYSISPKFVCTPIPPEADPSCYSPPAVPHGPSSNGHSNGLNGSSRRAVMSDEAKATILHLRESLVRQKETILDQRETIRELTAKLTLCEGFGGHHGNGHHDNHHDPHHDNHHSPNHDNHHDNHHSTHHETHHDTHYDTHHDTHPDKHHDDHIGHHSSHHPSSSYHGPSSHHSSDHHYSHGGHRFDPHHRTSSSYGKHSSFSPEQTGKTLQTLKERLENLQARNSSSSYSSSLRELLQRKIKALEDQLHSYYREHRDSGKHHQGEHHDDDHHDDHHSSSGHFDDHHGEHHDNSHHSDHHVDHHGPGHHDDHHDGNHNGNHHYDRHHGRHYDHHTDWPHGRHYDHYDDHHDSHHSDHHDDHHDDHHYDHHDDHHYDHHDDHHWPPTGKETRGHSKLERVLSKLHHSSSDHGHVKLKSPSAFLLDFPMRTNYMYARMKRSVINEIFALTICVNLKAGSGPGLGTPFSYAVPGQANELVLIEWGSNPMELLINDKAVTLPITMTDGKWHHVCVTWSTRDGVWEAYQDGVKKGSGQNLSAWHAIKPGGLFILGQEQDTLGGRFDVTQSFTGEMSDLQFWSRVLSPSEIYNQATCSGHLVGDVLAWLQEAVELHGGLTELPFDPCH
ncbi:uncharacterized protein ACB058_000869 isoform 1-T2 [Synchiropus picturatus]